MNTTNIDQTLQHKPLGEILEEAALINSGQVEVALMEQSIYQDLRIGEILALHGWITQKTVDFFAELLPLLIQNPIRDRIGNYFYKAGLLNKSQIQEILNEQAQIGSKFGAIAVLKGFIEPETLSFFLKCFFPNNLDKIAHKYLNQEIKSSANSSPEKVVHTNTITEIINAIPKQKKHETSTIHSYEELTEEGLDDIPWID